MNNSIPEKKKKEKKTQKKYISVDEKRLAQNLRFFQRP